MKSDCVIEPQRSLPVVRRAQLAVAGGGIAGISAALAAARRGKRVLLIEREYSLGGMATLGLITIYLPLCDGAGHQLVFGQGEELLRLSVKYAHEGELPTHWLGEGSLEDRIKNRYMARFNPHLFALAAERLLLESGVEILYGTAVAGASVENGRLQALVIENKSGRSAVVADSFIDCTGDADVAHLAGAPTLVNPDGNGLASWYYYSEGGRVSLKMFGLADVVPERGADGGDGGYSDSNKTASLDESFRFSGVDGVELSRAVLAAHGKMFSDILSSQERSPGLVPVTISSIPLVRMSRRIVGLSTMEEAHDHQRLPDSVGMTGDWCRRGPVYEIPFGALHCAAIKNLLVAGRCISTSQAMWNVTRVIPPCAVSGQAAGTAAALGSDFTETDIPLLQKALEADGVKLHL